MNTNIDGAVYFANKSYIKPLSTGTLRLKLPSLPDMILCNVLYLLQLQRNLLSLCSFDNKDTLFICSMES